MRKTMIISATALLLASCESEAESKAKWIAWCAEGDFTSRQCEVLYSIVKNSREAANASQAAQIGSGIAIGVAIGSGSR